MAHAQRRIAVRQWLDTEKKWANALLPTPTKKRTSDPLLAALAARQREIAERRRCAQPGDKTIVRCGLTLAAT